MPLRLPHEERGGGVLGRKSLKIPQFPKMQRILSDCKQNNLITQSMILLSDRAEDECHLHSFRVE